VPTSAIAPSLGRNLSVCGTRNPCTSTATVPLVAPGTMFADRMTRLDLRLGKRVRLGNRVTMQGNFNVFNVFTASPCWRQQHLRRRLAARERRQWRSSSAGP
jgi:hypothetical protein